MTQVPGIKYRVLSKTTESLRLEICNLKLEVTEGSL